MISIIVPVYNVEKYIRKFIESVLSQSFTDFELLLINDGTTDNSAEICREYAKLYDNIVVIDKENGGQGSARNLGMKHAKGDWIMFADSDDFIHRQTLEIMYENVSDADIVMCGYDHLCENEEPEIISYETYHKEIISGNEACIELCCKKGIGHIVCWGKLIKKEVLTGVEFPEDKLREDEFFAHRLLVNVKKIIRISPKLYYYIQRQGSTMTSVSIRKHTDCLRALDERLEYFKDIPKAVEGTIKRYRMEAILGYKALYNCYDFNSRAEIKEFLNIFCKRRKLFDPNPTLCDAIQYKLIRLKNYKINKCISDNDFEAVQRVVSKIKKGLKI